MLQIQANEKKCIDLGRRGEDSARVVLFDISGWAELYGQGEAKLIAKRDHDLESYPAEITQNDTVVSWVIKPVDNDHPGYGNCELVYITGGSVVKSVIYQTHTNASLSDPVSPPDSPDVYGDLARRITALEQGLTPSQSGGIPAGGKEGQFLCKKSDKNYDVEWADFKIPEQYGLITYNQDKVITIT